MTSESITEDEEALEDLLSRFPPDKMKMVERLRAWKKAGHMWLVESLHCYGYVTEWNNNFHHVI
jgi:hypothetical protein